MLSKVDDKVASLSQRFRPALLAFFKRRLHSHAEAEDLTQDVLAKIAAHSERIEADRAQAYIFQIAANLLRDHIRRQQVRMRVREEMAEIKALFAEERGPDRILESRQSLATVVAALNQLPERTRTIFILFRLERMKQREIADMLGISLRTVENHVMQASAHLHGCFGEGQ